MKIALASYPRSGNTWLRFIMHGVAGWRSWAPGDEPNEMRAASMVARIESRNGVVIKTHGIQYGVDKTVCLFRDPADSIASLFRFQRELGEETPIREFLDREIQQWRFFYSHYLQYVRCVWVCYEDLKRDFTRSIGRMFHELNVVTTPETIARVEQETRFDVMQSQSGSDLFYFYGGNTAERILTLEEHQRISHQLSGLYEQLASKISDASQS